MDFKLSKTHQLQQELYRKFAEEEIKPLAEDMDETEQYDMELLKKLHKYGFFGIPYSKQYGGVGGDYLSYALAMEEVSKVDGSTGITISVHTSLYCSCIDYFGTEEQKEAFLRPTIDGSKTGCFGLTEPNAGSDAAGQQTTAVYDPDTDEYIINGGKVFTTNSGFADLCTVFAMTDKSAGTRGISCFVVDLHQEGVSISENIKRMGIRAAQNCEVSYENVRVPAFNRIGKEGQGFKIAMKALDGGRIGIAAQSVGLAQGAINEAMAYCKERKQFGRPISAFQTTQFKLADMQTKVDAARLLTWRAACTKDSGENYSKEAAMAKLFASDVANQVCREAVQLMGGYGYCREYPVERALRDAKITEIYEGTSEVMKMVISGAMKVNAK
ncbi:MAG: acyl-CoA dehydrogenase family protein [Clostridiales bacterium]|nr:acyl-CoA dehydrogenase family protein [Clostridiales bacterium]MDD6539661.1 acyl-CoA dehydrogenase family protein [Bacillota bacterium]MDD7015460.1 acyl-CoA dehydrogenase family protein [Bacillota bacterium]MDY4959604.1 acyl-CoA dehydrogenase family protein [Lentihominibacter sp.]